MRCDAGSERFDQVVLACHGDQALALLDDASDGEREILGAITYQPNDTVLHTDASLLPRDRKAWAAWNAHLPADPAQACTVSYCMNLLQGLPGDTPLVVTPQPHRGDRPGAHPAPPQLPASGLQPCRRSPRRRAGTRSRACNRTWFAGAYWGWGFHEDGMRSGVEVARALGVDWPVVAATSAG